jgi:hypothetical protein
VRTVGGARLPQSTPRDVSHGHARRGHPTSAVTLEESYHLSPTLM